MEFVEEKPKKKLGIYAIIIILIVVIAVIYFVFFSPAISDGGILSKISSLFSKASTDLTLVPDALKKDVTGGIINLKFEPSTVLDNSVFKSLNSYAEPVELGDLGRPNPFMPF
jgi:hypothetical protein